jgi:hypothetical protein
MATNKKKKSSPAEEPTKAPEQVEKEDLLILQIAATSRENFTLKVQLTQANLEKLTREQEAAHKQYQRVIQQANEKYNLVAGKDTLDINTGVITRGK